MIGIYKITSPTKKIYIGQSVNIEKRFKNYEGLDCKKQPAIYRSLLKYGFKKHKFEILCECDIEELNNKERYYQDLYNVLNNGLNCKLTKSSDRSGQLSQETINKIIQTKTGKFYSEEHKRKIGEGGKGKIMSKETRCKMSESHKGKKFSEEHKRKISEAGRHRNPISEETRKKMSEAQRKKIYIIGRKIILNTQTGVFYLGIKEATESININHGTLKSYLSGNRKNKTPFIYV